MLPTDVIKSLLIGEYSKYGNGSVGEAAGEVVAHNSDSTGSGAERESVQVLPFTGSLPLMILGTNALLMAAGLLGDGCKSIPEEMRLCSRLMESSRIE